MVPELGHCAYLSGEHLLEITWILNLSREFYHCNDKSCTQNKSNNVTDLLNMYE